MKCCLIGFLCILYFSQTQAQGKFVVEGEIAAVYNGKYMYLWGIDFSKMNPEIHDSALIKNGKFRFSGTINTPALLASLYLKDVKHFFTQLYVEPKVVRLKAIPRNGNGTPATAQIDKSKVNSQYKEWREKNDSAKNEVFRLYPLIDSLEKAGADSLVVRALQERLAGLKEVLLKKEIDFVRTHPKAYLSLYWLSYEMSGSLSSRPALLNGLFDSLNPALQQLPEGIALKKAIGYATGIQPGKKLPAFSIPDSTGTWYSLDSFKGKYILLDFWASWCKPCIEKMPELKELYSSYHHKGLDIVGISMDYDRKSWLKSLQLHQLPWVQLSQLKGWASPIAGELNITYLPQTILVDSNRNIVAIDPILPAKLKELLP
ncbi:protein of unknown function [Filimonas lacunae]|uniref:Thioredoxin domain-containing protein n=1 Tax=Filimonas lacunae TaxID=477680 RepID=A0A173MB95_9BACT|nr:TlpA disulfide reductase family protein [Filimonas lacunae]BAV04834.1 thiol:disulfide interchange protein [Filimonas lacunae]SIT34690.1 protein of unknown function [Filimonas lacunae]